MEAESHLPPTHVYLSQRCNWGFPGSSVGKESACNAGDPGSIPGLGDLLGKGKATHSSILAWRIPMDRGGWQAIVYGVAKSRTRLSD